MPKKLLAFDLGAESGRGILGHLDDGRLDLQVIHRFPNGPVRLVDSLHWNVLGLFAEMVATLRRTVAEHGAIDGLGVDTWGVDFGLLGRDGSMLGNPRHYRDPHTEGVMEDAFSTVSRSEIFRRTGLQFMRFNTLFQLLALKKAKSPLLDVADTLLMMPDLFNYFFTGIQSNEFTDASTSQMLDPVGKQWDRELPDRFGLPSKVLGTVVAPGTVLGSIRPALAAEIGMSPMPVIATASHDTAAAVASVPAQGKSWAYISSGTWSLMGVELDAPLINEQAASYNFTNEGGVGGTTRFLKNIMGLWLVQECKRTWERAGKTYGYDELAKLAQAAKPFAAVVDPDDTGFMLPTSMPDAIVEFCRRTGQTAPVEPGPVIRCALESLALRYRWVLARLEELARKRLEAIHVVGGGSQNELLCQLTADACNRPVLAGPIEATAIGNVLVQALGLGLLKSLKDAREIVRNSFEVRTYTPKNPSAWDESYRRFEMVAGGA